VSGNNEFVMDGTNWEPFISRVFASPRPLVWRMWTECVHFARWWGPLDVTNSTCEIDLQPGGAHRIVMRSPEGVEYPINGVLRETVTFEDVARKTRLTIRTRFNSVAMREAMLRIGITEGWSQSLDRLAGCLTGAR
jgi:uncharacterized protein YndB with AHSA1/START domain